MNTFHKPVMVSEVMEGLDVGTGKKYIDATFGGGGHSIEILKRGGIVLGIDQDPVAIQLAKQNSQWKIIRGNFRDVEKIAKENGFENADGILFDLGVSSHQINTPERGFSFRFPEAPLDLRMNRGVGSPAWEVLKRKSEDELYEIFASYGEEKLARTIAGLVVRARRIKPVTTTGDLIRVIGEAVGSPIEKTGTYARIFQALRIVVNDELNALKEGIAQAKDILVTGGTLVIISYHSLEDRIVKREYARLGFRSGQKHCIRPSETEIRVNSRSRSAKMRIGEKL